MNLEEDILIEKFIEGTLSKEDLATFLKRMDTDEEFEKKVLLEQQLREALNDDDWSFASKQTPESKSYEEIYKSDDIKELQSVIQNVNNEYRGAKTNTGKKWILFASAAVIALLISINVFYGNSNPQDLYTDYISETNLPSFISREDGNENELIKAQLLFENKEFEKSLVLFKKELKNTEVPEAGLYLYTGIAEMETNNFEEAELLFNGLIESDLLDAQKGHWYKALLYLKTERLHELRPLLENISEQQLYNAKKAEELLKKLY